MKKRILSLVLVVFMLTALVGSPTFAAGEEYSGYVYFYNDFSETSLPAGFTTSKGFTSEIDGESVFVLNGGEKSATAVERTDKLVIPAVTNINATEENALEGLNDLVFEYRVKAPADNGSMSYLSYSKGSAATNANLVFMAAPSYGLRHGITWNQMNNPPVIADLEAIDEWHTVSVVYPAGEENVRKLYVDGVDYGTSTDTDNERANVWAKQGKSSWQITLYSKYGGDLVYLDYIKAYEAPSAFKAEIENAASADRNYITVKFNNAYGAATLSAECFVITGGSESVKIKSFERVDGNTVKLYPAKTLEANTGYTLNITGVKDNLSNALAASELSFVTSEAASYTEGAVYYYNGFDGKDPELVTYITSGEVDYTNTITEDGKTVFKVQGLDVHQNVGNPDFRTPPVKFNEMNAPDELVLEYRLRLNAPHSDSYLGVWAVSDVTKNQFRSRTVALGRYTDTKDKVFWHYTDKEPISNDFSVDTSEWTTVTIVYPKDVQKRKVYINGTYLGESAEGELENTYAGHLETALTFLPDFKLTEDILEVDYVKYFETAVNFNARVIDARASEVTLEFNSTPSNLSVGNIAFSDGTAVSAIKEIDERTFAIIPAEPLSGSNGLDLSAIKDTLGRSCFAETLPVEVEDAEDKENVFFFRDFDSEDDIGLLTTVNYVTPSVAVSDDGLTVFRAENTVKTNSNANGIFYFDEDQSVKTSKDSSVPITGSPVLVFEYKTRIAGSGSSANYVSTRTASELTASIKGTNLTTDYSTNKVIKTGIQRDAWNIVTAVYSNKDGSRRIYLNNEFVTEIKDTPSVYSQSKYKAFKPHMYMHIRTLGDYAEIDYMKLYSLPDDVKLENAIAAEDMKTVTLDFNTKLVNLKNDIIKIGGISASSVTLKDSDKYIYEIQLERKLAPSREHNIYVNGAEDLFGRKIYVSGSVTTAAAKEYNVTVTGSDSENGRVIFNETANEDEDIAVNVKANINYTATVTADGKVLEPDKAGNYIVRNANEDTKIAVDFAETVLNPKATSNKIPTVLSTYFYGTASWAFGSLRKEASEYGFIVAKTSKELESDAKINEGIANGTAIKMQAKGHNAFGDFGMMIIDKNNRFEGRYYVIPYAVYEGIGTVYGTATLAGYKR